MWTRWHLKILPSSKQLFDSLICWNNGQWAMSWPPLLRCGLQYSVEIKACSQKPRWRDVCVLDRIGHLWIGCLSFKLWVTVFCLLEITVFLLPARGHPLSLTRDWTSGTLQWSFLSLPCEKRTTGTQVRDQSFELFFVFSGQLYLTKMLLHVCFGVPLRTFKVVFQSYEPESPQEFLVRKWLKLCLML